MTREQKTQHTPGPWVKTVSQIYPNEHEICGSSTDAVIARITGCSNDGSNYDKCEANARLIATAPELLRVAELGYELSTWAACINWRGGENQKAWLDDLRAQIEEFQPLAQAAIKKAKGGAE